MSKQDIIKFKEMMKCVNEKGIFDEQVASVAKRNAVINEENSMEKAIQAYQKLCENNDGTILGLNKTQKKQIQPKNKLNEEQTVYKQLGALQAIKEIIEEGTNKKNVSVKVGQIRKIIDSI